jgi:hypothetical protein
MDKNAFFLPQAETKRTKIKERRPIDLQNMLWFIMGLSLIGCKETIDKEWA